MYTVKYTDHNKVFKDTLTGLIDHNIYPNPQLITSILDDIYHIDLVKAVKPTVSSGWYKDNDSSEKYQARSVHFVVETSQITCPEVAQDLADQIKEIAGVISIYPQLHLELSNNEAELEYGGDRVKDDKLKEELAKYSAIKKGSKKPITNFFNEDYDEEELKVRRAWVQERLREHIEDMSLPYLEMLYDISKNVNDYHTFFRILNKQKFLED